MSSRLYVLGLFALVYTGHCLARKCPSVKILSPCKYKIIEDNCSIICEVEKATDLSEIFTDLSQKLPADQKQFDQFRLGRTNVTELPANVFAGLQFKSIQIVANKLQRIHKHAFNGTDTYTTELYITDEPVSERVDREWDLFGAIHTLQALDFLSIINTTIRSLPTRAISGHKQLKQLYLLDNPIKSIATQAFNDLPRLNELSVSHSPIISVAQHAFTIGNGGSSQHVSLYLVDNSLTGESFADRAFDDIKCGVSLYLRNNSVAYLNRNTFEAFLSADKYNTIEDLAIDCTDSRNQWIQQKFPAVWINQLHCNQEN